MAVTTLPPLRVRRARVQRALNQNLWRDRVRRALTAREWNDLYLRHERTINMCVHGASISYARDLDEHEIQSEAHRAFLRVARNWSPTGGASFATLLNVSINRAVRTRAQHNRRHRRGNDKEWEDKYTVEPLTDLMLEVVADSSPESLIVVEQQERTDRLREEAATMDGLEDTAREVLVRLLEGAKPVMIARELSITRKALTGLLEEQIVPRLFHCNVPTLYERARARHLVR